MTNPNSVVVTTSPPVTGTVPTLPAACPALRHRLRLSPFAGSSGSITGLTEVAGQPLHHRLRLRAHRRHCRSRQRRPLRHRQRPQSARHVCHPGGRRALAPGHHRHRRHAHGRHRCQPRNRRNQLSLRHATTRPARSASFLWLPDCPRWLPPAPPALPDPCASSRTRTPSAISTPPTTSGGTVGGVELDPANGTLITNKNSPYGTSGQPTCVAAITHAGGNAHHL